MIKRDQFGRDIRKFIDNYLTSEQISEMYYQYIEDNETMEESVSQFVERVKDVFGLKLKEASHKQIKSFPAITPEQALNWQEIKQKAVEKYKELQKDKPKKKIKQFSDKRQKTESSYKSELKQKYESIHGKVCCDGCGTCQGYIDPSHFIPRSVRPDLIDDPENFEFHCRERCHKNCESGNYSELKNGAKIIEYMKRKAPEYLMQKLNNKLNQTG